MSLPDGCVHMGLTFLGAMAFLFFVITISIAFMLLLVDTVK